MKKTRFYLLLCALIAGCALLGCSDDNTPEPEPDPVPPVEEPEPDPEPVIDTVALWSELIFSNYETNLRLQFLNIEYDSLGRMEKFRISKGEIEGAPLYAENVSVEWGKWGNKQVVMKYDKEGVSGQACTATYTLNDKGWMEKVVVEQGSSKLEEYQAEYTDTGFTLYEVKSAGKEKLYSASIAAGARYGDWTATEAADAKVTVDYADFATYTGRNIGEYVNLDILLTTSYAGWLMPERVLWAHVAGMFPGQAKFYNNPKITYNGSTQDLFTMEVGNNSTEFTFNLAEFTMENSPVPAWQSSPDFSMKFTREPFTRPGKK